MADPTTETYAQMILDVEFDPSGAPGTYTTICGIKEVNVTRQTNMDTDETGDCSDESQPFKVVKTPRSLEVTISGNGTWAQESHDKMMDWWRGASTLNVRLRNTAVASGEIETESGSAYLVQLNNTKVKGKVVSADISIEFSTLPAVTDKS